MNKVASILREVPRGSWMLLMFAVVFGLILAPRLSEDHRQALDLRARGKVEVATDVEVHVNQYLNRTRLRTEVNKVRVRLPGSEVPVELEWVPTRPVPRELGDGWRAPDAVVGYQDPLPVIVERFEDGTVLRAAAEPDAEYYATHDDSGSSLEVAVGAAVLAVVWDLLWRRHRALGRRTSARVER